MDSRGGAPSIRPPAGSTPAQEHVPLPRCLPQRGTLWLIAAALLAATVILGAYVWHGTEPSGLDRAARRARHSAVVAKVVAWVNLPHVTGTSSTVRVLKIGLVALILVTEIVLVSLAWRRSDWWAIVLCLGGPLLALVLTEAVAKPLVSRRHHDGLAYPSGHVAGAAALSAVVVLLVHRWRGSRSALRSLLAVALLPLAVGFAVVRLGLHYPTDSLGGMTFGAAIVVALAAALPWIPPRLRTGGT